MKHTKTEVILTGVPASPGIAIGTALVLESRVSNIEKRIIASESIDVEIENFDNAVEDAKKQILEIQKKVQTELNDDDAKIFDAHLLIIDDHTLINGVKSDIKISNVSAAYALYERVQKFIETLNKINDPYLKERGSDIWDVASRVIANLHGQELESLKHLPGQRIIVSHDLTPSDTVFSDRNNVQAFITETGSRTSHAAIIARSMNIPAVLAVKPSLSSVRSGDVIIVDGYKGEIILNPTSDSLSYYARKETKGGIMREHFISESTLIPETLDGFQVQLAANIEFPEDINDAIKHKAYGVGLYRTEYLYLNSEHLPSEKEQFDTYKKLAVILEDKPFVIRTLDLGGDKLNTKINITEENPFLGYRAIRLSLGFPKLFETQLTAILKASAYGNVKLMFPMITCIEEVKQSLELLSKIKLKLKEEKIPYNEKMEVGVMIETPSAALIADKLASIVDFFSIGTNDLVQYTLAVDRNSKQVAYLYQPTHPAILTLIKRVVDVAKLNGIWVSICGEMAGDPQYTPLLIGMGVHELSMSPLSIGSVRRVIRKSKMHEAESRVSEALKCPSASESLKISLDYLNRIEPNIYNLTVGGDINEKT